MLANVLELNPQLFREVKSRFRTRNIIIVVFCSLSLQNFLYGVSDNRFVSESLDYILPLFLLLGGFYLISTDLAREEQRGTLNFIRLSPQSSQSILIGKMLGVPALIYLGVALGIPLHFISSLKEGVSFEEIFGKYLFWIVGCWLFYSFACLYTFRLSSYQKNLYNPQAIAGLGLMLAGGLVFPYLTIVHFFTTPNLLSGINWFFLTLGRYRLLDFLWLLITVVGATYFLWQAVNRLYRSQNITIVSKSQSYHFMALLQLWILGFVCHTKVFDPSFHYTIGMVWVYCIMPIVFLMLISALSPSHQTLLDWARYKHQSYTRDSGLWNDLIGGEKSPAVVAIAINLLITAVIWIPWFLSLSDRVFADISLSKPEAFLGILLTMGIVVIYALIAQQLTIKFKPRSKFNLATVLGTIIVILPLAIGGVLFAEQIQFPLIWVISPFPILCFMQETISTAILGLGLQFTLLGFFTKQLVKQVQKLGASKTQILLTAKTSQFE